MMLGVGGLVCRDLDVAVWGAGLESKCWRGLSCGIFWAGGGEGSVVCRFMGAVEPHLCGFLPWVFTF